MTLFDERRSSKYDYLRREIAVAREEVLVAVDGLLTVEISAGAARKKVVEAYRQKLLIWNVLTGLYGESSPSVCSITICSDPTD